jgi:APA family basic amino acid/polyamine antiporter
VDLPRRFTLLDTTMLCIGGTIGSGIYLKPAAIATLLPSSTLVMAVWIAAGVLTLLGALTYAGLTAARPQHGGLYVILTEAYGPLAGFLFGWSLLALLETGSIAGLAAGVAQLVSGVWPLGALERPLAAALIILLSVANAISVKGGAWVQNLFTAVKTAGLAALLTAGLLSHGPSHLSEVGTIPAGLALASAFGVCMVKALWAYDGWINLTFVAGEVRDPETTLPKALTLGTLVVIAVYLGANLAYHRVLPLAQVQGASSVGADVAMTLFGTGAAFAMTLLMMASTFGTLNSSILTGARVYFAMARARLFFPVVGRVTARSQAPGVALALQAVWSIMLLGLWGTFDRITDNVIFIYWIFYALGAMTVFRSDIRPWGYPWVPLIFVAVSAALTVNSIAQHPTDALQAFVLLGSGLLLYPLFQGRQHENLASGDPLPGNGGS